MASLKEVKNRIVSIESTKKITLARQMVSSARLHQSQHVLEQAKTYKKALGRLLQELSDFPEKYPIPCIEKNDAGAVALIIMSSNSGMCGSFNANMVRILHNLQTYYPNEELLLFPVGKKIREAAEHAGYEIGFAKGQNMDHLMDKTSYQEIRKVTLFFTELYLSKAVKQVDLIYYQYKNRAIQEINEYTFLPYSVSPDYTIKQSKTNSNYIFEPSEKKLWEELISMIIQSDFYYRIMENQTSEHASRTMAMQLASENADEMLSELQLAYNKLRQQNITTELLDIIGGSFK